MPVFHSTLPLRECFWNSYSLVKRDSLNFINQYGFSYNNVDIDVGGTVKMTANATAA